MSRLIKFRADNGMGRVYSSAVDYLEEFDQWRIYDFDEEEWMYCSEPQQFTGLHDKNGVEIYEGDVLDIENEGYPFVKNWKGIVKFIDGSYLIENFEGTDGEYLFDETREVKVIGNIHEHPHLLEGS